MEIKTHIYKPQSILIIPIGHLNKKMQENVKGHRKRQEFDLQTKGLFWILQMFLNSFEQEFSAQTY